MIRLSTFILLALLASASVVHAQRSAARLTGAVRTCYAVSILDRQQPVDSLQLDGPERLSDSVIYLVCMASAADVTIADPALGVVSSQAGLWHRGQVVSQKCNMLTISPLTISGFDPRDLYQPVVPVVADTVVVDSVVTVNPWDGRKGEIKCICLCWVFPGFNSG